MALHEPRAGSRGTRLRASAPAAAGASWWGPLDGPRAAESLVDGPSAGALRLDAPDAGDLGGGGGFGSPSALRAAGAPSPLGRLAAEIDSTPESPSALHQQLDSVRLAIAERNRQLAALASGDEPGSEAAALRAEIRRAIADRQSLQEEMKRQAREMQSLDEACLGLQGAEKLGEGAGRHGAPAPPAAAPSSDASFVSTEEAGPDGASCWRECVAALEGEIRRKSQLALELHHRVHALESQLHQQLQATDDRVETLHSSLKYIADQLVAYPA